MADLITIDDLENALGREPTEYEEAEWQRYITLVSSYINESVDVSFTETTETVRLKADGFGQIKLKGPVTDIVSVKNFRTGNEDPWVDFDGIDTLFYLEPHQVVDVTYTHGYSTVPADIKDVCVNLVLNLLGENTPTNIIKYRVGDVEEQYSTSRVANLIDDYVNGVLDRYRQEWYSIPLAYNSFPDYQSRGYIYDFDDE